MVRSIAICSLLFEYIKKIRPDVYFKPNKEDMSG
jgi:hypothetical protein